MKSLEEKEDDLAGLIKIIIGVVVVILTIGLFILWQRRKSKSRHILITGLSDSGKTLLFVRLLHSRYVETFTSAKENVENLQLKDKLIQIVDIPGHERLRYKYFDQYKSTAKGIVFVIDSTTIQQNIRDVAEFIYNLLCDPAMQKGIPFLILCNKQDQVSAKGPTVVENLLQKEMNLVRVTKSKQLDATDNSSSTTFIGKQGQNFEFSQLNTKVEFAVSSAYNSQSDDIVDLEQFKNWLNKVI